jgi:hypothetical protein
MPRDVQIANPDQPIREAAHTMASDPELGAAFGASHDCPARTGHVAIKAR